MGYFKDGPKGRVGNDGIVVGSTIEQFKINRRHLYQSSYVFGALGTASVAYPLFCYAAATQYPKGIDLVNSGVFSDHSPWLLKITQASSFSFTTYAPLNNWRTPTNQNLFGETNLTSFCMGSFDSIGFTSGAPQVEMFHSGSPAGKKLNSTFVKFKPSKFYAFQLFNYSTVSPSYAALSFKFYDPNR